VLRTRSPLRFNCIATAKTPFDLHVLTTPPAFILSQDQTLRKELEPSDSELLVSLAEAKLPYLSFLIGGPNQSHRVNFKEPFPWGKRSKRTDRRTVVNHFFGENHRIAIFSGPQIDLQGTPCASAFEGRRERECGQWKPRLCLQAFSPRIFRRLR
jgi:hypothetical protein